MSLGFFICINIDEKEKKIYHDSSLTTGCLLMELKPEIEKLMLRVDNKEKTETNVV